MTKPRAYKPALIDETSLGAAVRKLPRLSRVRYMPVVSSTNACAFEVLNSNDSLGISFVTESQEQGRGRAGRHWICPPAAGVLISTILPADIPNAALPAAGFWTALAVMQAVRDTCGVELQPKWPNDLLLGTGKCAGILAQSRSSGGSSRVIVGVGINANRPEDLAYDMPEGAAWLSDAAGRIVDRTALIAALLHNYEDAFDWLLARPQDAIQRWAAQAQLVGKHVSVRGLDGRAAYEGTARGISAEGALLLDTAGGGVAVTLGDVQVL